MSALYRVRLRPLRSPEAIVRANPGMRLRRAMRWDVIRSAPMSRAQVDQAVRAASAGEVQ